MDLGPLAQPLFYQYKCINGSAKASCIKRSNGIFADRCRPKSSRPGITKAQGFYSHLNHQPAFWNTWHRSRGHAPCLPSLHPRAGAEGGGGCLTSATAQLWQVQNSRRRLEPSLRSLVKPQGTSRNFTSTPPSGALLLALGPSGWPAPSPPDPRTAVWER